MSETKGPMMPKTVLIISGPSWASALDDWPAGCSQMLFYLRVQPQFLVHNTYVFLPLLIFYPLPSWWGLPGRRQNGTRSFSVHLSVNNTTATQGDTGQAQRASRLWLGQGQGWFPQELQVEREKLALSTFRTDKGWPLTTASWAPAQGTKCKRDYNITGCVSRWKKNVSTRNCSWLEETFWYHRGDQQLTRFNNNQ